MWLVDPSSIAGATRTSVHAAFDIDAIGAHRSEQVAVRDGAKSATYAELDDAANQVAHGLTAAGLRIDDRVAYLGNNNLASVQLMVGAPRAGVVVTLLNWRLHPAELASVLSDCGARMIVVSAAYAQTLAAIGGAEALQVLVIGGDNDTWEQWLAAQPKHRPEISLAPDRVALQLYTSGTTGLPKGAMLTAAGLSVTMTDTLELWQMDESSVALLVLPLFHIIGVATVLIGLWSGGTLVLENDTSPSAIRGFVADHAVTNVVLVTVLLDLLAHGPTQGLRSLRTISYGGSPIGEELIREVAAAIGCRLVQIYGLTETAGSLTALLPEDHELAMVDPAAAARLRSCGRARPGVDLRIADVVSGAILGPGEIGEVQARSLRIMAGYWGRPEETAEVTAPGGWFCTGDLGEIDEGGYLFLRDRLKDMIVSGAENIYPIEVERALLQHPAVQDVAVVGVPHERWGETPRALVMLRPESSASEAELIAFTRDRIAHYKCPTSVGFLAELPRNPSGKVLRRVLREPYWVGQERRVN